jgi:hypothetical protein
MHNAAEARNSSKSKSEIRVVTCPSSGANVNKRSFAKLSALAGWAGPPEHSNIVIRHKQQPNLRSALYITRSTIIASTARRNGEDRSAAFRTRRTSGSQIRHPSIHSFRFPTGASGSTLTIMSEDRLWKFKRPEWLNSVWARNAGVYAAGGLV